MRSLIKVTGIILLICAVGLYIVGGLIQEETQPQEVRFGIINNGQYIETGSGTIGGSSKTVDEMEWLKRIGILSGIAGLVTFGTGMLMKRETEPEY